MELENAIKEDLKRRAEEILLKRGRKVTFREQDDIESVFTEFETIQIELELQNEELRQAFEALEKSKKRYSELYEFAPVAYLTIDGDSVITEANLTAASMLRTSRSSLVGMKFTAFVSSSSQDDLHFHRRYVQSSGEKHSVDLKLTLPGNIGLNVIVESYPTDGPLGLRMAIMDITQRKKAEEIVLNNDERLKALEALGKIEDPDEAGLSRVAMTYAVQLTSSEMGFIAKVDGTESRMLASVAAFGMRCPAELGPKKDTLQAGCWAESVRLAEPVLVNDYLKHHPAKKGLPMRHIPVKKFLSVPFIEDGKVVLVLTVANKEADYNEFDRQQLMLFTEGLWRQLKTIRTNQELTRYAETKSMLLQEVNHRVKNNLSTLLGILSMEEKRLKGHTLPQQKHTVEEFIQEFKERVRGLSAVHSMLSTSQWEPLEITALCRELIKGVLENTRSALRVDLNITGLRQLKVTSADAHHLALVLNELATNSLKYAFESKIAGLITVDISRDEDCPESCRAVIRYSDDGPGYPENLTSGRKPRGKTGFDIISGVTRLSMGGDVSFENDSGAVTVLRIPCLE